MYSDTNAYREGRLGGTLPLLPSGSGPNAPTSQNPAAVSLSVTTVALSFSWHRSSRLGVARQDIEQNGRPGARPLPDDTHQTMGRPRIGLFLNSEFLGKIVMRLRKRLGPQGSKPKNTEIHASLPMERFRSLGVNRGHLSPSRSLRTLA